jgi:hypothetical protein
MMSSSEPTIVHARTYAPDGFGLSRVEHTSADEVLKAVELAERPGELLVVLDSAVPAGDRDELVALASVLVVEGVRSFETHSPKAVRRVLDMYTAITSGQIEVLES